MSQVKQLNHLQFETDVLNSDLPVVVDFYATWCPPCRMLAPILDRLATEFDGQIKFVKIDSDQEPQLAAQYNITGLPTLMLFDQGQSVKQVAGLPQEEALRAELRKWIESRKVSH